MSKPTFLSFFTLVYAGLLALSPLHSHASETDETAADDSVQRGLEIAIEADRRDTGFGDTAAELTMVLQLSDADRVERNMRQMILEVDGDGDKSIMVFDRPLDLQGTAILTFTHKVGNDDQWLYLPALKRVKRISSADKSGPFMGSEFAYEDLASQEVEKYAYRYLRDEDCEGEPCYVVERTPVDPRSGYSRQVTWIDHSQYRLRRTDYYDRKGDLLKTMTLHGYQQYLDRYWRADQLQMINHRSGRQTLLQFHDYQFRTGLSERDFNRAALARMR